MLLSDTSLNKKMLTYLYKYVNGSLLKKNYHKCFDEGYAIIFY